MNLSEVITCSYGSGYQGVAGIGVAFRRGRVICGDIVEVHDLLGAELCAILRALEISSRCSWTKTVVGCDHELAVAMANDPVWVPRSPIAAAIHKLLATHDYLSVEQADFEAIKPARILARQIFKAWKCSFNAGVTWDPRSTAEGPQLEAAA